MNRLLKRQVVLYTQCGKTTATVEIIYEDESEYKKTRCQISLNYGGVEYVGNGTDFL